MVQQRTCMVQTRCQSRPGAKADQVQQPCGSVPPTASDSAGVSQSSFRSQTSLSTACTCNMPRATPQPYGCLATEIPLHSYIYHCTAAALHNSSTGSTCHTAPRRVTTHADHLKLNSKRVLNSASTVQRSVQRCAQSCTLASCAQSCTLASCVQSCALASCAQSCTLASCVQSCALASCTS